jgi:hypothetical protein
MTACGKRYEFLGMEPQCHSDFELCRRYIAAIVTISAVHVNMLCWSEVGQHK